MTKQEQKLLIKQLAKKTILDELKEKKTISKKSCLQSLGDTLKQQLKVKGVVISIDNARSNIGTTLSELKNEKAITLKEGIITIAKDDAIKVTKEECKIALMGIIKKTQLSKKDITNGVIHALKADQTESTKDDDQIKSYVGTILSELIKENVLTLKDNLYSLRNTSKYTKTPIGEKEFKKQFFERLHENGGAFFEKFLESMLERYYSITQRDVLESEVVGGSEDGGVDIIIKTSDDLGFIETIMIQAKCRLNTQVTEKEVREFYGAVNAQKGSRGMFVTTSTFHKNAKKLLDSIENCVGIDGEHLFNLVKKTSYGIHQSKNGYKFDELVFVV